jgi:hypothetical protein
MLSLDAPLAACCFTARSRWSGCPASPLEHHLFSRRIAGDRYEMNFQEERAARISIEGFLAVWAFETDRDDGGPYGACCARPAALFVQ